LIENGSVVDWISEGMDGVVSYDQFEAKFKPYLGISLTSISNVFENALGKPYKASTKRRQWLSLRRSKAEK